MCDPVGEAAHRDCAWGNAERPAAQACVCQKNYVFSARQMSIEMFDVPRQGEEESRVNMSEKPIQRQLPLMRKSPLAWLVSGFLIAVSFALSACGGTSVATPHTGVIPHATVVYDKPFSAGNPNSVALVDFVDTVRYSQAVATLANLGLFPYHSCGGWLSSASGVPWSSPSVGALGNHDSLLNSLYVYAPVVNSYAPSPAGIGPAAPTDWVSRLAASPQVDYVENGLVFNCPLIPLEKPVAGRSYFLASAGTQPNPTYLQVTFTSSATYQDAVTAAMSQGMRLARPCAEAAHDPWQPLSQESAYASGHTLTLALTIASSTLWRQQLRALPGVVSFQEPYEPSC